MSPKAARPPRSGWNARSTLRVDDYAATVRAPGHRVKDSLAESRAA